MNNECKINRGDKAGIRTDTKIFIKNQKILQVPRNDLKRF